MKYLYILILVSTTFFVGELKAQFDDLYYNPDTDDTEYYESYSEEQYVDDYESEYYDDDEYDDYEYFSEYDDYYASRIRRFRRSNAGFGYYNGYACNSLYYDPFDMFYNPFGFGGYGYAGDGFRGSNVYMGVRIGYWGGLNHYYSIYTGNPYRRNGYFNNCLAYNNYSWYGYGNGYGGGYGGGYVYGNGHGHGNGNVGNVYPSGNNAKGTHYGSRRAGSTSSSIKGERRTPRVAEASKPRNELMGAGIADNTKIRRSEGSSRTSELPARKGDYNGTVRTQESPNISRERRTRPSRNSISSRTNESSSRAVQRSQARTSNNSSRKSNYSNGTSRKSNSTYSRGNNNTSKKSSSSFSRSGNSRSRTSGNTSRSSSRTSSRSSGSSGARKKG